MPVMVMTIVDNYFDSVEWDFSKINVRYRKRLMEFDEDGNPTKTDEYKYFRRCKEDDFKTLRGREFY